MFGGAEGSSQELAFLGGERFFPFVEPVFEGKYNAVTVLLCKIGGEEFIGVFITEVVAECEFDVFRGFDAGRSHVLVTLDN
jgi:hypothetical protein